MDLSNETKSLLSDKFKYSQFLLTKSRLIYIARIFVLVFIFLLVFQLTLKTQNNAKYHVTSKIKLNSCQCFGENVSLFI